MFSIGLVRKFFTDWVYSLKEIFNRQKKLRQQNTVGVLFFRTSVVIYIRKPLHVLELTGYVVILCYISTKKDKIATVALYCTMRQSLACPYR